MVGEHLMWSLSKALEKPGDVKAQLCLDGFENCLNDVILVKPLRHDQVKTFTYMLRNQCSEKMLSENPILTILE